MMIEYTLQCGTKLPEIDEEFNMQLACFPAKILKDPCSEVEYEALDQDAWARIAARAVHLMYKNHGIGLAAPQMHLSDRFFVWDTDYPTTGEKNPKLIVNPEICVNPNDNKTYEEGCLSIALGWKVQVGRYDKVKLSGYNFKGEEVNYSSEGIESACWQHEIDHLDGTLIIDYDGKMRRELYERKLLKFAKRHYIQEKEAKRIRVQLAKMKTRGRKK